MMGFDTSFKKKWVRSALLGFLLGVVILLTPFLIFAYEDYIFEDNFNSYSDGDLTGQGDWLGLSPPYTSWKVQGIITNEGSKAIRCSNDVGNSCWSVKSGNQSETGRTTFYIYLRESAEKICGFIEGMFYEEGSNRLAFQIKDTGEGCKFWVYDSIGWEIIGDVETFNEFFPVEFEWVYDTKKWRVKWENKNWSEWLSPEGDTWDYINKIILKNYISAIREDVYIDTIKKISVCELGNCSACEIYDTCINAGCFWYYSIFLQQYFCVEPFEPEPEECGSFYKCQYCLTQGTCEAELNCEWVDKGFGEKCYMIEPEIPPEQITWEVPELEDCSLLSGVEKWLCDIKNFVAGIFLPSQEKMDSLYQSIMSLKDKFPFNYIGIIKDFFTDIKNELASSKEIPIKIFGVEGNVDFSFWDKTVVIGGLSETFGNILIDFTSFIILLSFFVWLMSFIRRIF